MIAALVLFTSSAFVASPQDVVIDGVPYERLETRAATERRMLDRLVPDQGNWGTWYRLGAFAYPGFEQGALADALAPEAELEHMHPGGPGPDLGATYVGKHDSTAAWSELGPRFGQKVDLHLGDDEALQDFVTGYVYARVESARAAWLDVHCGSDDGLRLWWNGELLVDVDAPRSLDPRAHALRLPLVRGTNHLLAKVADGAGGWEFELGPSARLAPATEAALYDQLDRDFPPSPDRAHYAVTTIPTPLGEVIEVGGLDFLQDGTPLVATRRGDVWRVLGAYDEPATEARFERFASGLHEPLGLSVRVEDGRENVYVVQRGELTRLVDADGDGVADRYETVSDGWGVSGNYHEFAFGPKFDDEGNAWLTLNVGFCGSLGKAPVPYRGWCLKIAPDGTVTPWCDGLRSPNGIGRLGDDFFYVDNQGDYVATCRLTHLARDSWAGHPASLRWREDLADGERPPRLPASVWFPYQKMGQSSADIATLERAGFGPFEGQLFVGDQTLSSVGRVFLEEVEGFWQGACFPFLESLQSGVNRVAFAPDGSLFVGQTDRGWGSVGRTSFGLQRVRYLGEVPFEIRAVRATEDGFVLEFTKPIAVKGSNDVEATSWTYAYHAAYGAPEIERKEHATTTHPLVEPSQLGLTLDELREGFVYELRAPDIRSVDGEPLVHPVAYYTLQRVPGRDYTAQAAPSLPKVLFLTHSAGYQHDVVRRPAPDTLALAEAQLVAAAKGRFEVVASQDCATIHRDRLHEWDAVVFYTTGELPLPAEERGALVDWVRNGGAFVGVHSATDTYYEFEPYQAMLGGVFDGHPWHEAVRLVTDRSQHPALASLADEFELTDEIYQFREFARPTVHELVRLVNESVDVSLGSRRDRDYALSWCKPFGRGRVFYTALGHRPEVWEDERFLGHVVDGLAWSLEGPDTPLAAPDGARTLDEWTTPGGEPAAWPDDAGVLTVAPGTGNAVSAATFGDAWIHVEFNVPATPAGTAWQDRGNSGVYVHGRYEVQVLDSLASDPYRDGDAGSIYGVAPPAVNACRAAGRWQSYDIEFRAPRFDQVGEKLESARMSVWQNGVPIHRDVEVPTPTQGGLGGETERGPLLLQDHGSPVSYRNLWILER
ncbi:MAG: ThuA domain-containing protein [Planctomycetota bacterium]